MGGLKLPSGSELGFFTQSDGTTIKTLQLSESFFDVSEQGAEEFSRVVTERNDEDGEKMEIFVAEDDCDIEHHFFTKRR